MRMNDCHVLLGLKIGKKIYQIPTTTSSMN